MKTGLRNRHIYFFGSRSLGWYKLGVAFNPDRRMRDLQAALPFEVEMIISRKLNYAEGCQAFRIEDELQRKFSAFRARGEWFQIHHPVNVKDFVKSLKERVDFYNA